MKKKVYVAKYSVSQLISLRRMIKSNGEDWIFELPTDDSFFERWDGRRWTTWLRGCLNAKINAKSRGYGQGRKFEDDYQFLMQRISRQLKHRVAIAARDVPAEYRQRLRHRIDFLIRDQQEGRRG